MNWLWLFTIGIICIVLVFYNLIKSNKKRGRK